MSCQSRVTEWSTIIPSHVPRLSKPQATVFALWRLGMVLARSCALTAVSVWLAVMRQRTENTVRQQVREWCYEAEAKRGAQRQALIVEDGFVPLLGGVLHAWQGTRVTVWAIRVVDRGGAVPVAWTILLANTPHAWRGEWRRMLRRLRPAMPTAWTVIVRADRGLYAGWLFRRLVRLGWHPFLRITTGGSLRPDPRARFHPLASCVPRPGTRWRGTGPAFKSPQRRLRCPVLACWAEGDTEPWLILTDLPPEASDACWSGLRAWIEPGVKLTKRAGWQWHRTRMTEPQRAARLWLAVAVAPRWRRCVGGAAEETIPPSTLPEVSAALAEQRRPRRATRLRLVSIFRRGWITMLVAWLRQAPLPLGAFLPEPWPTIPAIPDMRPIALGVEHVATL